jgi:hypothetical protein
MLMIVKGVGIRGNCFTARSGNAGECDWRAPDACLDGGVNPSRPGLERH